MHTSLAISGSEGQKTASAGSEGSGKPAYPIFGPKPVLAAPALMGQGAAKAAPAIMGQGAAAAGQVTDLDDSTRDREFALEFLRSSESDSGNPYGPETTSMRKRGPKCQPSCWYDRHAVGSRTQD